MNQEEKRSDKILDEAIEGIRNETTDPEVVESAAKRVWARISEEVEPEAVGVIRSCADFQALLPAYRAGELSEARALLVKDHTHECMACRKVLMGQRAVAGVKRVRPEVTSWPFRWAVAAALALTVGLSSWYLFNQFGPAPGGPAATVASLDGDLYRVFSDGATSIEQGGEVAAGEQIRAAKDSGAVIRLRDGSLVEVRERSDFSILETRRDVTIRLAHGSVIVEAAKRSSGHLYVSTRDCRVAVTGTVFSVTSGVKGSRVSVIEGEVRVARGSEEEVLLAGAQFSSSSRMAPVPMAEEISWSRNADTHLALLSEFVSLAEQMEQVELPEVRYSSSLLNHLPAQTAIYVAIPNLGETLSEANQVLQQRIQESATLREWWEGQGSGKSGLGFETVIDEIRRFSDYLGEEIVMAAMLDSAGKLGDPVFLAELKQGGFAEFVQAEIGKFGGKPIRVFNSQAAIAAGTDETVLMYVGQDTVVISRDAGVLRQVAASLEGQGAGGFAGTALHAETTEAYREGASMLFSADLEGITAGGGKEAGILGNVRHMVVGQKQSEGRPETRAVITFGGARQGLAAWLANPSPIGALDFVSPDASIVSAFAVNDLRAALDELFAKAPEFREELAKAEAEVGVDIRNDLAAAFGAEFVIALDGPALPVPSWKLVAEVYDPGKLQMTIETLAEAANRAAAEHEKPGIQVSEETVGGRTYHLLVVEAAQPFAEMHYVFVDGYLVAAPSRGLLDSAIASRATGSTLATSALFTSLLPRDRHANFSAMAYHNMGPALAPLLGLLSPQQQEAAEGLSDAMEPTLVLAYGAEDRITVATTAKAFGLTPGNLFGLKSPMGLARILKGAPQGTAQ